MAFGFTKVTTRSKAKSPQATLAKKIGKTKGFKTTSTAIRRRKKTEAEKRAEALRKRRAKLKRERLKQ